MNLGESKEKSWVTPISISAVRRSLSTPVRAAKLRKCARKGVEGTCARTSGQHVLGQLVAKLKKEEHEMVY